MAGGKIRLLWDRDEPAVVNIYGGGGALSTAFTIDGDVVEFPYSLTGDVTLATTKSDTYSLSATQSGVGTLGGTIHLDPDITFVLTYRGPVAA